MRLWSVHPRYLDRQALVACWRETLLAQAVLAGATKGYRSHPQLLRFRATVAPVETVGKFLCGIAVEADARGYRFDRTRILQAGDSAGELTVTYGQLEVEWRHLMNKMLERSPEQADRWRDVTMPDPHPLFTPVPGAVADWERAR